MQAVPIVKLLCDLRQEKGTLVIFAYYTVKKKNIYCMYTVPNLIRFLGKSLSPHLILISEISEYKSRNVSGDIFFEIVQEIFKKMVQDIL